MGRTNTNGLFSINWAKYLTFKVGITGGIGSGKSSVTALFANRNIPTFSSDAISRELCEPGEAPYQKIVSRFGERILHADKTLDRTALGNIVFNDPDQLAELEHILHPAIFATMHSRADLVTTPYCVLDIPLLVGTHEQEAVDRILVIDTSEQTRVSRVQARSGWSQYKTRAVMNKQRPTKELIDAADDVLENNGSLLDLEPKVQQLHEKYLRLAN